MKTGTDITKRNGSANFYARVIVPEDVRAAVGRAEIWESLRTPDARKARKLGDPIFAKRLPNLPRSASNDPPTKRTSDR